MGEDRKLHGAERCVIVLLHKGKIVERMVGEYDSYGRVFIKGGRHELLAEPISEGDEKEDNSYVWEYASWSDICSDKIWFGKDETSGFAMIHEDCLDGPAHDWSPKERTKHDPNQGWGSEEEWEEVCGPEDDDDDDW